MKISQLIEELQFRQAEFGDVKVFADGKEIRHTQFDPQAKSKEFDRYTEAYDEPDRVSIW